MDSDRLVGKRTFPVRFGRRAALCLMGAVVALMDRARQQVSAGALS